MARRIATGIVLAGAALVLLLGGPAAGSKAGGVKGVLLDSTCPGPCMACPPCPGPTARIICPASPARSRAIACPAARGASAAKRSQPPTPYTGPDGHVSIRRLRDMKVVARPQLDGGRFSVHLPPGRYRVHGFVSADCWSGQTVAVKVTKDAFAKVNLYVTNTCVLAPQRARR
jgi:hypothetical protein